jgi:hypothetical protein
MKGPLPDDIDAFIRSIVKPEQPLSVRQVSLVLGVHMNTVKRIPAGELPYFTIGVRGDRRYQLRDVRLYVLRRTHNMSETSG